MMWFGRPCKDKFFHFLLSMSVVSQYACSMALGKTNTRAVHNYTFTTNGTTANTTVSCFRASLHAICAKGWSDALAYR